MSAITDPTAPALAGVAGSALVPAHRAALPHDDLFGALPLVSGEDAAAYDP